MRNLWSALMLVVALAACSDPKPPAKPEPDKGAFPGEPPATGVCATLDRGRLIQAGGFDRLKRLAGRRSTSGSTRTQTCQFVEPTAMGSHVTMLFSTETTLMERDGAGRWTYVREGAHDPKVATGAGKSAAGVQILSPHGRVLVILTQPETDGTALVARARAVAEMLVAESATWGPVLVRGEPPPVVDAAQAE